jgi:hypothetical protein
VECPDVHRHDDELDGAAAPGSLAYHGCCNQRATNEDLHAVGVPCRAGYDVDPDALAALDPPGGGPVRVDRR